jgi:hypothetical protein
LCFEEPPVRGEEMGNRNRGFSKGAARSNFKIENLTPYPCLRIIDNGLRIWVAFMKKKFNFIDLVLMLPAVIALIYGLVSTT